MKHLEQMLEFTLLNISNYIENPIANFCISKYEHKKIYTLDDVMPDIQKLNTGSGSISEDKLLCYAMYRGRGYTCTVYTDKPATQLNVSISQYENVILPQDDGKHLFITNLDLVNEDNIDYVNLIYEDGSSIDLKGKVIEATQDA